MAPTPENLSAWYRGIRFVHCPDEQLYKVQLPSREQFFVRRARAWQDVGTLYEIFVEGAYADHPPIAGRIVLDVGANIGDTAVYFGKRGAIVTAYEPDAEMCGLARRNVAANGLRADIRNAGIGGNTQALQLSTTRDGADSKSATLFADGVSSDSSHPLRKPIQVIALADAMAELGEVTLLKIDCQGCEYPALRSVSSAQLRGVAHIMMEYHGGAQELADKLRESGYSVRLKGSSYLYADRASYREGASAPQRE